VKRVAEKLLLWAAILAFCALTWYLALVAIFSWVLGWFE
jgi:hypothetical protein